MSDLGFDIGGTPFTRARRNLVIMSSIILVYATGAISINTGGTGAYAGLGFKFGREWIVESWLVAFWVYFVWRYHVSFDGSSIFDGVVKHINEALHERARQLAFEHFSNIHGDLNSDKDNKRYYIDEGRDATYKSILVREVTAPTFTLESALDIPSGRAVGKKSDEHTFVMPESDVAILVGDTFFRRIFSHNHFSEIVWPYILAIITYSVLFMHWGYQYIQWLKQ